jgi:hypothetical protein
MDAEKLEQSKKEKYHVGIVIMILLAAATLGEYGIGVAGSALGNVGSILMLVALFKSFLVVRDYMHVGKLFSSGDPDRKEH